MVSPKQNVLNSHCLGLSSLHFCLHSLQTLVYWFIALCFDVIALLLVLLIFNVIRFVVAITPLKALTTHCDAHTPSNELKMCVEILCQNQLLPKTTQVKKPSQAQITGMVKIKQVSLLQHPSDTVLGQVCNYQEQKHIFSISDNPKVGYMLGLCYQTAHSTLMQTALLVIGFSGFRNAFY